MNRFIFISQDRFMLPPGSEEKAAKHMSSTPSSMLTLSIQKSNGSDWLSLAINSLLLATNIRITISSD